LRAATGIDLEAQALAFSALNWWLSGRWEQAMARRQQAIAGASARGAAVGHAASLALGAHLLLLLRAHETTEACAAGTAPIRGQSEQALRLCLEQGIGMWRILAEILLGRLTVERGEDVAGIERMRNALAGWQAAGMRLAVDRYTVVLADGCLAGARRHPGATRGVCEGHIATGLAAIDDALGPAESARRQAFEAELNRLRGELLLARGGLAASEEALACFEQALALAREKGALAWELRAAMSIVRLRTRLRAERQGEGCAAELAEARERLADVYGKFTEGFDFPDLQDAAALIGAGDETLRCV
jgi:tetratricopeptide (TPR) repeat protein